MTKLLECTRGPWILGYDQRNRQRVFAREWEIVKAMSAHDGRRLPQTEREANAALIAASYDHALIGWSSSGAANVWDLSPDGKTCRVYLGQQLEPDYILEIGTFSFPTLTDDLRQRLISEMEATQ